MGTTKQNTDTDSPVRRDSYSLLAPRVKLVILLVEVRLQTLRLKVVQLLLVLFGEEQFCTTSQYSMATVLNGNSTAC